MQVLLNCYLATFLEFKWTAQKSSQMTIILITLACVIALVLGMSLLCRYNFEHNRWGKGIIGKFSGIIMIDSVLKF